MQKFLSKVILFLSIPLLYLGFNMMINYLIYSNHPIPVKKTNVLIIGDSHTQKNLDPKYFNDAKNISQLGEPYTITYWKLKKVFSSFIPDTVIIGFAPHNISEFNDFKFSDQFWSNDLFKKNYPILRLDEIDHIIPVDFSAYYDVLWKQTGLYPRKNHFNYIGSYSNTTRTQFKFDCNSRINRHFYRNTHQLDISNLAITYLDKIVELSSSKKFELIFVSSPIHKNYLNKIPPDFFSQYNLLKKELIKNHVVFDQTSKNYSDSLFLDCDHLNENGAKLFSQQLIDFLSK